LKRAQNLTASRDKPDATGTRRRLDVRLSAPRHNQAYVSDILFGTSLHMHITLTSAKIAHDANQVQPHLRAR
jgi:hypothetical protein